MCAAALQKGEPLKPTWDAGTSPYKISSFKTAPQTQFQSRVHIYVSLSSTSGTVAIASSRVFV